MYECGLPGIFQSYPQQSPQMLITITLNEKIKYKDIFFSTFIINSLINSVCEADKL